jgi:hypothetical protein
MGPFASILLATPALAIELFRNRGAANDGGTLEYVCEVGERNPLGALETQEFRTTPVPFWLVCFSDTVKGPLRQMFFVVLLPDGTVVEPSVAKRL